MVQFFSSKFLFPFLDEQLKFRRAEELTRPSQERRCKEIYIELFLASLNLSGRLDCVIKYLIHESEHARSDESEIRDLKKKMFQVELARIVDQEQNDE